MSVESSRFPYGTFLLRKIVRLHATYHDAYKRSLTIDAGSRPRRVGARGPCRSTCVSWLGLRSPIPPIPQRRACGGSVFRRQSTATDPVFKGAEAQLHGFGAGDENLRSLADAIPHCGRTFLCGIRTSSKRKARRRTPLGEGRCASLVIIFAVPPRGRHHRPAVALIRLNDSRVVPVEGRP